MKVIGTAGHVDHGKSTLVKRLTGIDPDRLEEEKAREMTIDLGFAWLTLPDQQTIGIVDVPGHRDFIENMLAGIGGIDAVLLVIAADEGPMPQTIEHLQIIDLLGIDTGIVVLSKVDMVSDDDWLELVEIEIHDLLENTNLSNAEIIRVSGHTGEGISNLLGKLTHLLESIPDPLDIHQPRLPIDRVFSLTGHGTVVTGTLSSGKLKVGDEIVILPAGSKARIRSLQSYKEDIKTAEPGTRVAVNLSGVDYTNIQRGDTLALPDMLESTSLFDVYLETLPGLSHPIKHNTEIKIFAGTSSAIGHIRLLEHDQLSPNSQGWVQIRTNNPLVLNRSERIILRFPSPPETIGGAIVVNPHPKKRWKRFNESVLSELEKQLHGTPTDKVIQFLDQHGITHFQTISKQVEIKEEELQGILEDAVQTQEIIKLDKSNYCSRNYYLSLEEHAVEIVETFHEQNPLQRGIKREELRSKLSIKNEYFQQLIQNHANMQFVDKSVQIIGHTITYTEKQKTAIQQLLSQFEETPYQPPNWQDCIDSVGDDVLHALIEEGTFTVIQSNVLFQPEKYERILSFIKHMLDTEGQIDVANLRDYFSTSRKYAIAILEHLDNLGITQRTDNIRIKGSRFSQL